MEFDKFAPSKRLSKFFVAISTKTHRKGINVIMITKRSFDFSHRGAACPSVYVLLLGGMMTLMGCAAKPEMQSAPDTAAKEMPASSASPSSESKTSASKASLSEVAVSEVAVRIDTMMCVDGCFNGIKELLEKRSGIEEVRLAPQKEEGTIDNSVVIIQHRGNLDTSEIERLILGAGFEKIEFVK